MGFVEAVKTCFNKYAKFEGRATRSEYWWFQLFYGLVMFVAMIVDFLLFGETEAFLILTMVALLPFVLPNLAVTVRRLHDSGKSGWFLLVNFIPYIGAIILIVLCCLDSEPTTNQYGPSPKYR